MGLPNPGVIKHTEVRDCGTYIETITRVYKDNGEVDTYVDRKPKEKKNQLFIFQ